jgi:hypothetical protein
LVSAGMLLLVSSISSIKNLESKIKI